MDQSTVTLHYETAKSVIRRATKSQLLNHPRLQKVYGERGETINRTLERDLNRKEQVTYGRLRSGHHPELKYLFFKINRAVDTSCRKSGIGEETADYIMTDCPRIHGPPARPISPNVFTSDPGLALQVFERWKEKKDLPDVSPRSDARL